MAARFRNKSILTERVRTLEFKNYTQLDFDKRYHAFEIGEITLEEAFPDISTEAQEFILYGTTRQEWEDLHKTPEKRPDTSSVTA